MQYLADDLTRAGRCAAALLSVEIADPFEDHGTAERAILDEWSLSARHQLPAELRPPPWPEANDGARIRTALGAWAEALDRPLVLFLDEVDGLQPEFLASFLRQLRSGFSRRPRGFPASLALVGMRDIRDYVIASGGTGRRGRGSPFNISSGSFTLEPFTRAEVADLYGQHTAVTGQPFTDAAIDTAHAMTRGQPWLVNALASLCVSELTTDRQVPIDAEHIGAARELVIQRRYTHVDSLEQRLLEPRVRRVVESILAGEMLGPVSDEDQRYVTELGLVRIDAGNGIAIANPIYSEVIPRALAAAAECMIPAIRPIWLTAGGRLDESRLLDAFLTFWRQHGEPLMKAAPYYHEIAPHLVLMAFLHRVANGGGRVEREFAVGSRRMDLCLRFGGDAIAIELKVWRPKQADPREEGLVQLDAYIAGLGVEHGWLVIFDRRPDAAPVAVRTQVERAMTPGGREVTVLRA